MNINTIIYISFIALAKLHSIPCRVCGVFIIICLYDNVYGDCTLFVHVFVVYNYRQAHTTVAQ